MRKSDADWNFADGSEILMRLSCYEPAGHEVVWTETDLLQHVLTIGMTGSGKTSQLRRIIRQLIQHQAGNPQERVGLCILDAKVDDTVAQVKMMASAAMRQKDVVVLGPTGDHVLDLFDSLRTLADVERTVRRLSLGSKPMGFDNAFWEEYRNVMLDAALTLLVVNKVPVEFDAALEFIRRLFFLDFGSDDLVKQVTSRAQNFLSAGSASDRRKVGLALELIANWRTMEGRTKSNVQATLMNVIRPLVSVSASRCFESHGRRVFDMERIVNEGCIGVVSANALAEPGLASLVFKLAKEQFFRAVHSRGMEARRLCGIIADEWPLVVTPDDVEHLATVRSKRCFFLAATQGLSSLDDQVGPRTRRALMANFGSLVLFRTREEEVDTLAATHFGTTSQPIISPKESASGDLLAANLLRHLGPLEEHKPVCPPGTLGRLAPHQAFVSLPESGPQKIPVWLVPAFEDPFIPNVEASTAVIKECKDAAVEAARLMSLMRENGAKLHLCREVLAAAFELSEYDATQKRYLEELHAIFAVQLPLGLESLPMSWLKGLPGILRSMPRRWHGHFVPGFKRLSQFEGVLLVDFTDVSADTLMLDQVRSWINRSLYPCLWRRLHHRQVIRLKVKRPDLGPMLEAGLKLTPHPLQE